jgi:hypothetical protein
MGESIPFFDKIGSFHPAGIEDSVRGEDSLNPQYPAGIE